MLVWQCCHHHLGPGLVFDLTFVLVLVVVVVVVVVVVLVVVVVVVVVGGGGGVLFHHQHPLLLLLLFPSRSIFLLLGWSSTVFRDSTGSFIWHTHILLFLLISIC